MKKLMVAICLLFALAMSAGTAYATKGNNNNPCQNKSQSNWQNHCDWDDCDDNNGRFNQQNNDCEDECEEKQNRSMFNHPKNDCDEDECDKVPTLLNKQGGYGNHHDECEEAVLEASAACATVDGKAMVSVTIKNTSTVAGEATVNGQVVAVAGGATKVVNFESGTPVKVVVDGKTVLEKTLTCDPGQGGGTPQTPATPVVAKLPNTSAAVNIALIATGLSATTAVLMGGSRIVKAGFSKLV